MRTMYTRVLMTLGIALFGFLASPRLTHAQWTKANNGTTNVSNCVLLTDGTVVCQEGETTSTLVRLTPDQFGSYANGTWSDTNINPLPSGYAPRFFCSAVLADGRVIFIGGEYNDSSTGETNLGAILDPTANSGMGSWTTLNPPDGGASPWNQIGDSPCVILPNKKLLLGHFSTTQIAQLDPATLTWTDLSPTGKADGNAEEGFTLLPDGTVLVVDTSVGFCGSGGECNITAGVGKIGEIYTPSTNAWTPTVTTGGVILDGNVPNCCVPETGPQILRPDGTVIAIGATPNTASYNYLTGVWTAGPSFPTAVSSYPSSPTCTGAIGPNFLSAGEADGPGAILPDGNVLVAASPIDSSGNEIQCTSFFEFDGTNLNPVAGIATAGSIRTFGLRMLVLPTGDVLVTAGGSNDVELYNNGGTYLPAWQPTITSAPTNIGQGETYPIFGTQFNGLSQGAAYGDDSEFATNYPLVRIVNNGTGHVFYARTHDHSTMGVATGSAIVSTTFDVPSSIETGASQLFVVANGIPSAPFSVNVGLGTVLTLTGASATSSNFNDAVTVQAQLTSGGSALSGKTITFVLGSGSGTETCSAPTDGTGTASCPITPNQPAGTYTLTASFGGDLTYGQSSASTAFTVFLEETALAITGASATNADYNDSATVQALLTTDGNPLPNEQVTFVLGSGTGTETCTIMTDGTGVATCPITPNQQAGPYTLTATFAGDPDYVTSSTNAPFTINKEEDTTKFTLSSPTVIANGHPATFSATVLEDGVTPIQGRTLTISIGAQSCLTGATDPTGTANCSIVLSGVLGPGTVTASFAGDAYYLPSSVSEPVIVFAFLNSGSMIIGNLDGNPVEFWGSQWSKLNFLSSGPAPSAFKGFGSNTPQSCGGTWTTSTGNSSNPPATLPSYMGVIVSSSVVQSGSTVFSGNVPRIVVVKTNPGYGPMPSSPGTGTVVATFCP